MEGRFGIRDQLSNLNSFPDSHGDSVAQGAGRDQTGCGSTVRRRLTVLVWFIQQGFSRRNLLCGSGCCRLLRETRDTLDLGMRWVCNLYSSCCKLKIRKNVVNYCLNKEMGD